MKTVLVIAPHPDDETLGCGGTLLRHRQVGDAIHWLIVTSMQENEKFSKEKVQRREIEIAEVKDAYGFQTVEQLNFPAAGLNTVLLPGLIEKIDRILQALKPEVLYLPYPGDVHSDHKIVFQAAITGTKSFRYSFIRKVLTYETLSETEFGIDPCLNKFIPNCFINIDDYIAKKIAVMQLYQDEIQPFPFPRSEEAILALAKVRGATIGCKAAEAFMILKEIIR